MRKRILTMLCSICVILALLATVIVQLMITSSGNERYFDGDAEQYYQDLLDAGFPQDYAVSLTELHLLHPSWQFVPLLITEQEPTFTWDYVIEKETEYENEDGGANVIYSSDTYAAYHHPTNKNLYDAGYYQASVETVEYFMDPRNFLNETDIFQFYSLSGTSSATLSSVEAILEGTFMEDQTLENGKSYAEYFLEIGTALNVNPIFLAAKVRQEQGTQGTSPLISGACGDKLWDFYKNHTQVNADGDSVLAPSEGFTEAELRAFNGYYNYFNVSASGNGLFTIYLNAMKYAANKGTESMASSWGGSGAWNTRWKALYGGASFLKQSYIDRYQSTIYLQKFNVDSRSGRNFTYQYMASVFGAMTEGRTLHQSFAVLDSLDLPATFLIPVYEGMPTEACPDPANGSCKSMIPASAKYSYEVNLTAPQSAHASNSSLYLGQELYPNGELKLVGAATHSYTLGQLEYSWDGADFSTLGNEKNLNRSLFENFSENTSHILVVRGKATYDTNRSDAQQTVNTYFLFAVIYVQIKPQPSVQLSFAVGNTVTDKTVLAGDPTSLPACEFPDFAGWIGSDGSFLPSGAEIRPENDLTFSAIFLEMTHLEGAALDLRQEYPRLRFSAAVKKDAVDRLTALSADAVSFYASVTANGATDTRTELSQGTVKHSSGATSVRLDYVTESLTEASYRHSYSVEFHAVLHYTNGESATLTAMETPTSRNAREVAEMALEDISAAYPPEMLEKLAWIANY